MTSLAWRAKSALLFMREMGLPWVSRRALYQMRLRTGLLEWRLPAASWEELDDSSLFRDPALNDPRAYLQYRRAQAPAFFFVSERPQAWRRHFQVWDRETEDPVLLRAARLLDGRLRYFGHLELEAGAPPAWHRNPLTGEESDPHLHWSRVPDHACGDIKLVWEPSRFGFVYDLVRAEARHPHPAWGHTFWLWLRHWARHNQPNRGANWKCGQEAAVRLWAWCFGLYAFLPQASPQDLMLLARMVHFTARRIEGNISYALEQQNNHGINEALGLWLAGALFPELQLAAHWEEKGRRLFEEQVARLFYPDGAFSQHSATYQRFVLQAGLAALALARRQGREFSPATRQTLRRAWEWLVGLLDRESGQLPNYGSNDGAVLHQLTDCAYRDFRPVVQAGALFFTGRRELPVGAWDEEALWLLGEDCLAAESHPSQIPVSAEAPGDCRVLRGQEGMAMLRCGRPRFRMTQADMLHLDIWWRGINLAQDPGTYSYNLPPPWDNALAASRHHNTVTVDGEEQAHRLGRFLWAPAPSGRVLAVRSPSHRRWEYLEAAQDCYRRLNPPVEHRRGILRLPGDTWLVLDRLQCRQARRYRLHWLLPLLEHWRDPEGIWLETPRGEYHVAWGSEPGPPESDLLSGQENDPRGWVSDSYLHRRPGLSLALEVQAPVCWFYTVFAPGGAEVRWREGVLSVDDIEVDLATEGDLSGGTLVRCLRVSRHGEKESL